MGDKEDLQKTREAICQYMNAQGPHMAPPWKEFLIEKCGLVVDHGNPYLPVSPPKADQEKDKHYIPPDKACKNCGAYTTSGYCSRRCAAELDVL